MAEHELGLGLGLRLRLRLGLGLGLGLRLPRGWWSGYCGERKQKHPQRGQQ